MREKLNNDPKAQIGMIALLVIVGAFLLISSMGGGGESETSEEPAAAETPAAATTGEVVSAPVEDAAAEASVSAAVPSALPSTIQAPPLPPAMRTAYRNNETVVLLIKHDSGIDDRLVAKSVAEISSLPNVAVFVAPSSQIYRYASITLGVEVSRVPALIVMRPRNLSGGVPQASVSYGFQSTQSVRQAVRDASYQGPGETYHPE